MRKGLERMRNRQTEVEEEAAKATCAQTHSHFINMLRGSFHLVLKTQIIPDMNNKIRRTTKLVAENKFYLLLLGEDSQAEADGLLVVVHLIVFLVHPLIKGIGV